MKNLPDFIADPSGTVHDIRHLKYSQNQNPSSEQDLEIQYTAYLNRIETNKNIGDEVMKSFISPFAIGFPIGLIIVLIVILKLLIQ